MTEHSSVPRHIAFIPDGNRRWARERGLPTYEGHRVGADVLRDISLHAFDKGVTVASAFIFSTENWRRSKEEVSYLMRLVPVIFKKHIKEFKKREVRVHWLGTYDKLGKKEREIIDQAVEETKHFTKGHFCLCFNYGGRQELVDAVRQIVNEGVLPEDITEETLRSALYAPEIPDIDLLVRTSGEQRISNFQLWRLAYSELMFIDKYWPDMTTNDIDVILEDYATRQRRHGA